MAVTMLAGVSPLRHAANFEYSNPHNTIRAGRSLPAGPSQNGFRPVRGSPLQI
jgi:hypothetical protein